MQDRRIRAQTVLARRARKEQAKTMNRFPMPPKALHDYEVFQGLVIHTDYAGVPVIVTKTFEEDLSPKDADRIAQFLDLPVWLTDFEKIKMTKGHAWRAYVIFDEQRAAVMKRRIAKAYVEMALKDLSSPETMKQSRAPLGDALGIMNHNFGIDNTTREMRKRRQKK
jgi:hypothetical protein